MTPTSSRSPHYLGLSRALRVLVVTRIFPIPYAVKGHGTGVNVVGTWRSIRPFVRRTLASAAVTIAVSRPMRARLIELGTPVDRAVFVQNGVDRRIFRRRDRRAARRE